MLAADYDQPARIVNPDDASRASLQVTVNQIMGINVIISDRALTDSSVLIIERSLRPTMENPVPDGRMMSHPAQFRLVINQSECILIDPRDQSRHRLNDTSCAAE
jgi:hypothetical protein